jgi:hypothetical protein
MLLTRLDDGGTCCLAAATDAIQSVMHAALKAPESSLEQQGGNPLVVQGTLIAALVAKLATSPTAEPSFVESFVHMLYSEMATSGPTSQIQRILRGLYFSCHSQVVRAALCEWEGYFWAITENDAHSSTTRNMALELLSWTVTPTRQSLTKLLSLVTANSVESALWHGGGESADEDSGSSNTHTDAEGKGIYRCTVAPGVGIRPQPVEVAGQHTEHGPQEVRGAQFRCSQFMAVSWYHCTASN